jgi:oligoribonuclease
MAAEAYRRPPEFQRSEILTAMHSPEVASAAPRKKGLHKAQQDILESIEEAKYYKTAIFSGR